jgi:phytoene dehydrogenase-like protein
MYDVIVIGRDLSSLIAALTSVQEGRRTALVLDGGLEMSYREAGYAFPSDLRPFPDLLNHRNFSRFIHENLISDYHILHQSPLNPAYQVLTPLHRIDIFQDQEALISDLIREYPSEAKAIKRFYRTVMKTGKLVERWIDEDEDRRTSGFIGRFLRSVSRIPAAVLSQFRLASMGNGGKDDTFRTIVDAQRSFLSDLAAGNSPLSLSLASLLSLPMRGLYPPRVGSTSLIGLLQQSFKEDGGTLLCGHSVIRMVADPLIAVDLEHEGSSATLKGKNLIVSSQWEKIDMLLSPRKARQKPFRFSPAIRSMHYPFCLHMGIHDAGIPEPMAPYLILIQNDHAKPTHRDLVYLQISLPGDRASSPAGCRAMTATAYLTESPLVLGDQELKDVAMEIIDVLEVFLPFLRENIDHLRVDQSIAFSRKYQEWINRKYALSGHFRGITRAISPKTSIPNVFLTGSHIWPSLGFNGEIIAGMNAAHLAMRNIRS